MNEEFFHRMLISFFSKSAVILEEPQQTDLNERISGIFTTKGNAQNINFDINFVQVDREQLDESFMNCKAPLKKWTFSQHFGFD